MGPKPFQAKSANQEFSFDKVFSVPQAPSTDSNGHHNGNNNDDSLENKDSSLDDNDKSPTNESDQQRRNNKDTENVKSDSSSSIEEDANSSDSGYKPKTPSTAERRRLFEVKSLKDESPENEDNSCNNFERGNSNRNSIAERRRLYENRSVSVTDGNSVEKTTNNSSSSPTSVRRRDSFKAKNEEETPKKSVSPAVLRQQSMDPKLEKPEPITTPTPKRTSTVFGRVSKFRHLKGTPGHKSTHIENVRNISRQISGECDGFHGNDDEKEKKKMIQLL